MFSFCKISFVIRTLLIVCVSANFPNVLTIFLTSSKLSRNLSLRLRKRLIPPQATNISQFLGTSSATFHNADQPNSITASQTPWLNFSVILFTGFSTAARLPSNCFCLVSTCPLMEFRRSIETFSYSAAEYTNHSEYCAALWDALGTSVQLPGSEALLHPQ